jgi:hypothetical protein
MMSRGLPLLLDRPRRAADIGGEDYGLILGAERNRLARGVELELYYRS